MSNLCHSSKISYQMSYILSGEKLIHYDAYIIMLKSFNRKEWIRSTKPYPISLSLKKLKDILDVNKPMDPDCFNMAVRMLACNEAFLWCEDKYHYMDLQFCVSSCNYYVAT